MADRSAGLFGLLVGRLVVQPVCFPIGSCRQVREFVDRYNDRSSFQPVASLADRPVGLPLFFRSFFSICLYRPAYFLVLSVGRSIDSAVGQFDWRFLLVGRSISQKTVLRYFGRCGGRSVRLLVDQSAIFVVPSACRLLTGP